MDLGNLFGMNYGIFMQKNLFQIEHLGNRHFLFIYHVILSKCRCGFIVTVPDRVMELLRWNRRFFIERLTFERRLPLSKYLSDSLATTA